MKRNIGRDFIQIYFSKIDGIVAYVNGNSYSMIWSKKQALKAAEDMEKVAKNIKKWANKLQ